MRFHFSNYPAGVDLLRTASWKALAGNTPRLLHGGWVWKQRNALNI